MKKLKMDIDTNLFPSEMKFNRELSLIKINWIKLYESKISEIAVIRG